MTSASFEPLCVNVPLSEDPPGIFRVGESRVLLELVISAFKNGESPEGIARSYRTLRLADIYAVISRYLANPAPFDEYLRQCDDQGNAIRSTIEATQRTGPSKDELLARARAKGLIP
jgi:hypothetical protein